MAITSDIEFGSTHSGELRERKTRQSRSYSHSHVPAVASRPFAGRIGGNAEFTADPDDSITTKVPDAAATFSWLQSFSLRGFADVDLWKEATIEGVGSCLQIYLAGMYALGLGPTINATALGPVTPAVFGSICNILLISLFIFASGPISGAHFNPLITMATFTARLSAFPRSLLYIVFQCTGAVIAGYILRASLGVAPAELQNIPGCYIDTDLVTPGEAYALETMTSFALVFLAFGLGLDPRQREVLGPALSPILVGITLGLCTFASGIVRPGYSGASLNPARCLGLMAPSGRFSYHYIHWAGDITTAILNGLLYWAIPIYKNHSGK